MVSEFINLESDVAELTRTLCDTESVSGNEKALADAIEQSLSKYPHLEVFRDGDAVVAKTSLGRSKRVIIAGHIDTVPIAGNFPSQLLSFEREQVIWGRGAVDMKAGVAVQLKLAATVSEPVMDVTWIFYDNEEVEASLNGLGRLARNHKELLEGDFAVLCEPTAGNVEGGCNGTMRVLIRLAGQKAHSARPWMGSNAIHKASEALAILASFVPEEIEVDGLVYKESLNAVKISGGIANNVIPDEALITINYRFAPSRSVAEAEGYLRAIFANYELEVVDSASGARPGLNEPAAIDFLAAVGSTPRPKYGWTDVARFSEMGIPAVNFGPGDPNKAHADDENVPVNQIYAVESGLRIWLTQNL